MSGLGKPKSEQPELVDGERERAEQPDEPRDHQQDRGDERRSTRRRVGALGGSLTGHVDDHLTAQIVVSGEACDNRASHGAKVPGS
jgi:hypothetical protein